MHDPIVVKYSSVSTKSMKKIASGVDHKQEMEWWSLCALLHTANRVQLVSKVTRQCDVRER